MIITLTTEEEVLYDSELHRIRELIPDVKFNLITEKVPLPHSGGTDRFDAIRKQFVKDQEAFRMKLNNEDKTL
ncbi:MAG: hypothetical protein U0T73_04045 [Chitinophagales bacterium]